MSLLLETIHIPHLYRDATREKLAARLYCTSCLRILRESLANCVILVDANNSILGEIKAALKTWDIEYRPTAMELFKKLSSQNRFVIVDDHYTIDSKCETLGCQTALGMASSLSPSAVLAPINCDIHTTCGGSVTVVTPETYETSSFQAERKSSERLVLSDGEWSQSKFELNVWQPLFRHTLSVRIFDRVIGHKISQQLVSYQSWRQRASKGPMPVVAVDQDFKDCLTWIFVQFLTHSKPRGDRLFEVTCELLKVYPDA